MYLFSAHVDYGHWIRSFQIQYLRAKGLSGYIMEYFFGTFTSYSMEYLYLLQLSSMDIYWSYILLQVGITSTGQDDINQGNFILDLLHTSRYNKTVFTRCRHRSPMSVNIQGYACSNPRT